MSSNVLTTLLAVLMLVVSIAGCGILYHIANRSKMQLTNCSRASAGMSHKVDKLIAYEELQRRTESIMRESLDQLVLVAEGGDSISIREFTNDTLILFFHSKLECNSCVQHAMGALASPNHKNLLLIADYDRPRELYDFKKRSEISKDVMVYREEGLKVKIYKDHPFFVVMIGGYLSVFMPDKDYESRTANYIRSWNI
jgi:hypothetical protein